MKKHISIILAMVLLLTVMVGCGNGDGGAAGYTDGTYTGEAQGMDIVKVSVTVTDGKISDVKVTEQNETPDYAGPALEQMPDLIVQKNSTDVDAISGATVTSNAIKEAVNNALEQAQ